MRAGDSLSSVSARFGVEIEALARRNGVPATAQLRIGQTLAIENRHLVPVPEHAPVENGILINVPQRQLFFFREGRAAAAHPVGLGRPTWRTPLGEFRITRREIDKAWIVPPSIQAEMRSKGKPVLQIVPPGPENPLGRHWLGLSPGSCGIHGTNAPASVYRFQTHGCIRLHPDDVASLFDQVELGELVRIVYAPLLLGVDAGGRVWIESHRDVYARAEPPASALAAALARFGLEERVDSERALRAAEQREGLAREITRVPPPGHQNRSGEASGAP